MFSIMLLAAIVAAAAFTVLRARTVIRHRPTSATGTVLRAIDRPILRSGLFIGATLASLYLVAWYAMPSWLTWSWSLAPINAAGEASSTSIWAAGIMLVVMVMAISVPVIILYGGAPVSLMTTMWFGCRRARRARSIHPVTTGLLLAVLFIVASIPLLLAVSWATVFAVARVVVDRREVPSYVPAYHPETIGNGGPPRLPALEPLPGNPIEQAVVPLYSSRYWTSLSPTGQYRAARLAAFHVTTMFALYETLTLYLFIAVAFTT